MARCQIAWTLLVAIALSVASVGAQDIIPPLPDPELPTPLHMADSVQSDAGIPAGISNDCGGNAGGCNAGACNCQSCAGGCKGHCQNCGRCRFGGGGCRHLHCQGNCGGACNVVDLGARGGAYNPDLFYNYYVPQTGPGGGVPNEMYPSPHATPYPAIQTYYTYQPWMPHEFLYYHNRKYVRYHSGGMGRTVTTVNWGGSPIRRMIKW